MIIKKINRLVGYTLFTVGVLRILIIFMSIIFIGSTVINILNDNESNSSYDSLSIIGLITGVIQIILALISIPMIFFNMKENPEVISGYLYGLGALLIEYITPSFLSVYVVFFTASLYMKGGSRLLKAAPNYFATQNNTANTEWFYDNKSRQHVFETTRNEKRNAKILEEIYEWRNLLDSGEIDETTYNEMKDKLLKKIKK